MQAQAARPDREVSPALASHKQTLSPAKDCATEVAHFGEMVNRLNVMQQSDALGQALQRKTVSHPQKRGASYELIVRSHSKGAYALEDALSAMLIRSYRSGEMAKEEGFYKVLKDLNGPTSTP